MTIYSTDRQIAVDGQKWLICAVRNDGAACGLARRPGEERTSHGCIQIDLREAYPANEACGLDDYDLLLLIESALRAEPDLLELT